MTVWDRLAAMVASHGGAALVRVHAVAGSAPREPGATLAMRPDGVIAGTIGGGRLEWEALRVARDALARGRGPAIFSDHVLGPDLGQCCGGRVHLCVETFDGRDEAELARLAASEPGTDLACQVGAEGRVERRPWRGGGEAARREGWIETVGEAPTPLLLFGAGHVGRALVLALAPLPFRVRWIDPRPDAFPAHIPARVTPVAAAAPEAEIEAAPAGAFVLVMTHSHPLDLAVTAAALGRPDLPFVGLIGSATKRARFVSRLRALSVPEARLAGLVCPIGIPGIRSKEPAAIAAATAAQLLAAREAQAARVAAPPFAFPRKTGSHG